MKRKTTRKTVMELAIERVVKKHGWPKRDSRSAAKFVQASFAEAQVVLQEKSARMNDFVLSLPGLGS